MVSSTTLGDVPITFARNSETDESFIHCSLSGDFDVVLHMKFDPDFLPSNDDTKREDHQEHTPGKVLGE
ncbi:MAG: hypothetical protein EOP84_05515 [Verrucomicrobiaceae bacterium]|nr:MAG: hypothetical protein EOP84_05515 [Verrucomicrobiaceae bacterium]